MLGSGGVDCVARVWDMEKLQRKSDLKEHTNSIEQLKWDPVNSNRLITASLDRKVLLWDLRDSSSGPVSTLETEGENINLAWSPDSTYCAVGDKDDVLNFIDIRKFSVFHTIQFSEEVNEFKWNPAGPFFFLTLGKEIVIMEWPSMKYLERFQVHTDRCYCLEFDPSGFSFALGGADAVITIWDTEYLCCKCSVDRLEYPIRTLSFSYDSQYIAAGSEDNFIDIGYTTSSKQMHALAVNGATNVVCWHPYRHLLAYATEENHSRDSFPIHLYGSISKNGI
eukprot:jgi/Galph1/316/GphlegSOOS_G5038.1